MLNYACVYHAGEWPNVLNLAVVLHMSVRYTEYFSKYVCSSQTHGESLGHESICACFYRSRLLTTDLIYYSFLDAIPGCKKHVMIPPTPSAAKVHMTFAHSWRLHMKRRVNYTSVVSHKAEHSCLVSGYNPFDITKKW